MVGLIVAVIVVATVVESNLPRIHLVIVAIKQKLIMTYCLAIKTV